MFKLCYHTGMTFFEKIKMKMWRFIYRFFPTFQRILLKWHIIWHNNGRQRYHIGWLAPGKTLEGLKKHLHLQWGFGNHFIAWTDSGQVLSWRKLADFNDQYHLRVFSDGEMRGHYEFTPEGHPFGHLDEKSESFRKKDFLKFLGNFVVKQKHISHLVADLNFNPDSEVSFEVGQKK